MRIFRQIGNVWLALVVLDGLVRLLGGVVQLGSGSRSLLLLLLPLDLLVVFGALAVWGLTGFVRQIPRRVVLPPLIAVTWMNLGALPFSIVWYQSGAMQVAVGLVLVASVLAAEGLARTVGHGRWGLGDLGDEPDVQVRGVLTWVAGWGLLGPVLAAIYLVVGLSWSVSWGSRGFVRLTPEGIAFAHKTYTLGDDTLHLIGMVHIGEDAAYDELFAGVPEGALALTEGVSDEQGLLTAPGDAYNRAASAIGLSVQEPIDQLAPVTDRNADVDVSTFDPVSIELLNVALGIYARPDDLEAGLTDYLDFWSEHRTDAQEITDQLFADILTARNEHLLEEVEVARQETDQIVLPWGALHLIGISEQLEDDGWTLQETRRVVIIRWSTLFGGGR